jgi:hypothetical protein
MRDQVIDGQSVSRFKHNARHHQFAPLWIGDSEDRRFENRRVRIDNRLDLAGENIFAASDCVSAVAFMVARGGFEPPTFGL